MSLRRIVTFALAAFVILCGAEQSSAQNGYPNRPIRIIVPFAPGGGVDTLARLMAEKMQANMGTPVVVENRAGANGTLGGGAVQQAAPDGYTVLFSANTHAMARLVMAKVPYDPLADFTPIARVAEAPMLVVMSARMPQTTLAEVAEAVRRNPEQWAVGTAALGSTGHFATLKFSQLAQAKLNTILYRGTAPALNDVAGGHTQLLADAIMSLLPMARAGNVKALAVTTAKRSAIAPEIPTAAESGLPGLEITAWYAMWGPKDMPADIVKRLNAESTKAIRELAQSGRLADIGAEPVYETQEQFARYQAAEVERNGELLKSVDFQPQ
jgi:tripartite-type tricarboxylate transporter receptor subunit TctC